MNIIFRIYKNKIKKIEISFSLNKDIIRDKCIEYLIENKIKFDIVSEIKKYKESDLNSLIRNGINLFNFNNIILEK